MPVAERMTIGEYLQLPHQEGRITNLVDGEIVVSEPLADHQACVVELVLALGTWCRAAPGRGQVSVPLDVELDGYNCFAPDVLWYRQSRAPGRAKVRPQPLPDIAAEVRSPSTWRYDVGAKKARYEQYGLPELWLVDTAADVVLVYRRSVPAAPAFDVGAELARGDALTSALLPGFTLSLDELFGP